MGRVSISEMQRQNRIEQISKWYNLYYKEHVIPDTLLDNTTLMLLLDNNEIVNYDSNWDDNFPLNTVTHWKFVNK